MQTARGAAMRMTEHQISQAPGRVNNVRALFHTQLQQLLHTLARMTRQTGQMITHASIALHQTDRALAALVITDRDQLAPSLAAVERRCVSLLALQARSPETCGWSSRSCAGLVTHNGWPAWPSTSPSWPSSPTPTP
jgi:hypothetical protein